ncbi:MAG: hypothetical protein LBQ27_00050, partial [Clostridiales bacterium]|nr:hypothetical protein [Clostridiales bacterium]
MTIYILPQKNYHIRMNGDSVCLDGKPYALKSDSGTYCFEFLSFMPFGAKYYPSFSARIVIKENSFSNISDCLSLTDWGGEIYELDVIPHAVMQNVPDVVLSAVEYVSLGRRFCASFICGCRDALAVDFLDNIQRPQIFCEYLPDKMSNVNLSVLTHENRQYLLVTGKTADRDYIMLLALNGENVDIIFEAAAEEIIFTSPNIIVKKHFKDMLRRKRSEYYTLQNGMCAEIKTEYSYEKSV